MGLVRAAAAGGLRGAAPACVAVAVEGGNGSVAGRHTCSPADIRCGHIPVGSHGLARMEARRGLARGAVRLCFAREVGRRDPAPVEDRRGLARRAVGHGLR
jgi:hypothetical protein